MQIFDNDSFRAFLGKPWLNKQHDWGSEWRFSVSKQNLEAFSGLFRDTLYHHHSSFDLHDDLAELGFVLSARALKIRNSGNPTDLRTQMGNLGEVLGAQFARTYLDYQANAIYPKRFNTNVEQSMKGTDILSFKDSNSSAEILFGEVKTGTDFVKTSSNPKKENPIEGAYKTLYKHSKNEHLAVILHFARAYFQNDKASLVNTERHMKKDTPRKYLLLSVTQAKPRNPFSNLPQYREKYGVLDLLAIHIEIKGLREFLPSLFSRG
jgi:hypothetical protein